MESCPVVSAAHSVVDRCCVIEVACRSLVDGDECVGFEARVCGSHALADNAPIIVNQENVEGMGPRCTLEDGSEYVGHVGQKENIEKKSACDSSLEEWLSGHGEIFRRRRRPALASFSFHVGVGSVRWLSGKSCWCIKGFLKNAIHARDGRFRKIRESPRKKTIMTMYFPEPLVSKCAPGHYFQWLVPIFEVGLSAPCRGRTKSVVGG